MNKKLIALVLACITLSAALAATSYLYIQLQSNYNELKTEHELIQSSYSALIAANRDLNDTNNRLMNNYSQLNQKYQILIIQRNELNASYRILTLNYTELEQTNQNLTNDYTVLNSQYTSLFSDYNALSAAFNQPLSYETIPATSQLEQWLATDNTNTNQYMDPNFICGDFSAMLSLHAKLNHWDIGMIGVLGHTRTQARFDHAFNAMLTTDGLVYIEPQTDQVWWYQNHQPMTEGAWWQYPGAGNVYIESYIIILTYN